MRVARQILNLTLIISKPSGSRQCYAKTSFNERNRRSLIHTRGLLVILQPGQEIIPGINRDVPGQVLQGLLHVGNGDVKWGLVSIVPSVMRDITLCSALATAA